LICKAAKGRLKRLFRFSDVLFFVPETGMARRFGRNARKTLCRLLLKPKKQPAPFPDTPSQTLLTTKTCRLLSEQIPKAACGGKHVKFKNKNINRALTAAVLLALQPAAWAESEMPAEQNIVQETESATDAVQADTGSMAETPSETEHKTGWWQIVKDNVRETWRSEHSELYIPLRTWHNRAIYSREKIKTFNEAPWGIGWGKVRDTPHNTTHSPAATVRSMSKMPLSLPW